MKLDNILKEHSIFHLKDKIIESAIELIIRSRRDVTEWGCILDISAGEVVEGKFTQGTKNRLALAPLICLMKPGKRYVLMHSHPDSTPFSIEDIYECLLSYKQIPTMILVGIDRSLYCMSKNNPAPKEEVQSKWEEEFEDLFNKYQKLLQAAVNENEKYKVVGDYFNEIWINISNGLGLIYSNLEGGRKNG